MSDLTKAKKFSISLKKNIEMFKSSSLGKSSDFITREMQLSNEQMVALFYLKGMVDKPSLQENIISPLLNRKIDKKVSLSFLMEAVLESGEMEMINTTEEGMDQILSGSLLLLREGEAKGLIIVLPGWKDRSISESKTQAVVKGPQDSFTETLCTNTILVRRRVKDSRVELSTIPIGRLSKTDVSVMYVKGIADEALVENVFTRLKEIDVEKIMEGEFLEELLQEKKQKSLFPLFFNSDRPDTIAAGIMEGKIAIFIDGTPFVMLVPSLFVDFFESAEDYYHPSFYSTCIRLLRYVAMLICMLTPAIYIALTTYHQEMIPTTLLLSISAQREGVPFPAFVEALLMESAFEILREAGLRMPRTIGQAISIVGTLVVGQAAVEASIVSAVMVIIVAITAISSFVIPSYAMSISLRLLRFVFMIFAAVFGVYGLTIAILILIIHLCKLNSFSVPYMRPIAPFVQEEQRDAIFRFPFRNSRKKA